MSNVRKHEKNESKVEFDNNYFKIHNDAILLIKNNFGAKGSLAKVNEKYIDMMGDKVLDIIFDIGTNIRIANSIYPRTRKELSVRRLHMDKAIGLCYDLLTKYQLTMEFLGVADDKYTIETGHLVHEINCIKKWRASDNKRFSNLV